MCLSDRDDVWPTWELTYGLTQQIVLYIHGHVQNELIYAASRDYLFKADSIRNATCEDTGVRSGQ